MPGLVRDGHGRRFVRVHVALIVPDVGAPHLIERGLLGLRALLAAQLQIGQLLLGGGLLVQPLFARFEQRLLLHLERELADLLDGAAPDFSALPGEVCLDASVIFQNLRDATHGSYGPGWDSRERRTARCHADRHADHPVQNESRRAIQWYRSVGSRIVIVPTSRAHPGAASSACRRTRSSPAPPRRAPALATPFDSAPGSRVHSTSPASTAPGTVGEWRPVPCTHRRHCPAHSFAAPRRGALRQSRRGPTAHWAIESSSDPRSHWAARCGCRPATAPASGW